MVALNYNTDLKLELNQSCYLFFPYTKDIKTTKYIKMQNTMYSN